MSPSDVRGLPCPRTLAMVVAGAATATAASVAADGSAPVFSMFSQSSQHAPAISWDAFAIAAAGPRQVGVSPRSLAAVTRAGLSRGSKVTAAPVGGIGAVSWLPAFAGFIAAGATTLGNFKRLHSNPRRTRGGQSWIASCSTCSLGATVANSSSLEEEIPPVWVVNLDKSVDRWEKSSHELSEQNVTAERFPATLGKALSPAELQEHATFQARYFSTPGMIGCFMSHSRIWQKVVDDNLPAVVVLEDDIVLFPKFKERLKSVLQELPTDWDVCLLGAVGCIAADVEALPMKVYGLVTGGGRPSPGKTRSISELISVPYRPAGTHAYVVSQKGAQTLLRECPKARYHVDLTAWALPSLKLYMAKDVLATQRFDGDTTVSKEGDAWTKRWLRWVLDISGLASMSRAGGVANLGWAWKQAMFALPVPFSRRRFIIETGPASSILVLLMLACIPFRSIRPLGVALLYWDASILMVRWLANTQNPVPTSILALAGLACLLYG